MPLINFRNENKVKFPSKVKHFLTNESDEDLLKQIEEYNNFAQYSLDPTFASRSILNGLKDINNMIDDAIISSAVKCVMQTAFQTNAENKLFTLSSGSSLIENELNQFHKDINADNILLTTGYNNMLWGQLPWKHVFNDDGILERVVPIPDFTKITPIIISGRIIGFLDEDGEFVPSYMYTYSQLEYYKNLGGNSNNNSVRVGAKGSDKFSTLQNEFTYANSYLGAASKPWRNVNVIEDGLMLSRMDQSNYYRIISVNVGGQVYSKSAIQVLNYYRNLFKKVRRVNYDSSGMSSRGNGQSFEVIVPQTTNQGVDIKNVGGEVDVKALKDLDTQYQRLFAALQLQPSMIGFSSDTPSSLGDSAAITWDKRFAKVCKSISYSAYNALRHMDYIHLRSLGYDVQLDDWRYCSVSQTIQEDADKGETLKLAVENLNKVTEAFQKMDINYNKEYLVKSILGDSLNNYGVDTEKLLKVEESQETEATAITGSYKSRIVDEVKQKNFEADMLEEDAHVMVMSGLFKNETATQIVGAFKAKTLNVQEEATPIKLKQVYSSFAVRKNNEVNLDGFVVFDDKSADEMTSTFQSFKKKSYGEGIDFRFPIHCSKDIKITAGDLDFSTIGSVNELYIDEAGTQYVTSKNDLCKYLYNYMNGGLDNYVVNVFRK